MNGLVQEIQMCRVCESDLELGPRPVVQIGEKARIVVIGQAPGTKVHRSGVPFDDPSGDKLRDWLGIDRTVFYDPDQIAIVPMGFCYPGKGKSGDLPPRRECAPLWHGRVFGQMPQIQLRLLVGMYAQSWYLGKRAGKNLTETVRNWRNYLPDYLPLPHPSPRNRFWLTKNPWFAEEVLPELKNRMAAVLTP